MIPSERRQATAICSAVRRGLGAARCGMLALLGLARLRSRAAHIVLRRLVAALEDFPQGGGGPACAKENQLGLSKNHDLSPGCGASNARALRTSSYPYFDKVGLPPNTFAPQGQKSI